MQGTYGSLTPDRHRGGASHHPTESEDSMNTHTIRNLLRRANKLLTATGLVGLLVLALDQD